MEVGNSFAACRLCLCQSESLSGVFDYCDGYTPADMIIELMRFEVSSTDIYPQCVCSTCVKKLTDFKKFKELCCVFKASFDRAYCSKYGGVTFGITSFPIGQTDVPSRIERIIWVEGACKQEEFVSHPKDTIPSEDEEELIVPDDLNAPVSVSTLPSRDVVKEENVTNVENPTETVADVDTTKYITELDSHSDANENLEDVKNRRDSSEALAVVEKVEECAVPRIVAGSHADREENACQVEGTMDSGAVWRVTRSMVVAKEKKKATTAGSSVADSQDNDAIDSLDDLEDSESNFQPEDMVDSDISDSSDKEFLPTPPKRSKNEAKGPDHPEMEEHGISSLSSSSETEDSDEDDNDDDELESKRRNVKPVHSSGMSLQQTVVKNWSRLRLGLDKTAVTKMKKEKGVYDCSLCGKRYFQRRTFRYHMDQHKFGNRFKCKICGKAFHRKVYLRTHMDVHQTEMNFQCDVCGKAYKSSALLYCHKKTHGEKNYACELCGKKFITVAKLNHHLKCHNRDKRYPCEKCGKTFTTKDYVTKHVQTVHLNQWKKNHCCEVCGKIFPSPAALKSHRMIHTGERPFKCSVCDKAFRTKILLENHVNTHTKENSYKCDVCDAVLSTMNSLARHKARHAGEMKYKCDNCGKQYTQSHNLKNHLKKCHTDSE